MNYMNAYDNLRTTKIVDYSLSYNKDETYPGFFGDINMQDVIRSLNEYPNGNYRKIKELLRKEFPQKRFVVGSGSEDLIWRINNFILRDKRVGVVVPNFYRMYQTLDQPYFIEIPFRVKGTLLKINALEESLEQEKLDAVWIGNPNPITGKGFSAHDLIGLIKKWPEIIFIIDEASMDAVLDIQNYSLMLQEHHLDNLIVLRTFSKFYGLPGMRFGYAAMNESFAKRMEEDGQVFPVSSFNYVIARKIFQSKPYFEERKKKIHENKKELMALIDKKEKFFIGDSLSNTVIIGCKSPNFGLWNILKNNGIISFSVENEKGMEQLNGVRITVDSGRESFENLYQAMQNMLEETKKPLIKIV